MIIIFHSFGQFKFKVIRRIFGQDILKRNENATIGSRDFYNFLLAVSLLSLSFFKGLQWYQLGCFHGSFGRAVS